MKSYTVTMIACGLLFGANVIFTAFMSAQSTNDDYFGPAIKAECAQTVDCK